MRSRRRPSARGRRTVIVTGAGSGATNNVIRSLRAADLDVAVAGCHHDRFVLKQSTADRNYLIPPLGERGAAAALHRVAAAEGAGLFVPTTDADVRWASRYRAHLGCRLFLPADAVIRLCQDKYHLATFLRRRGIPTPVTYPVSRLADVEAIVRRLRRAAPLWCRIRRGSGSAGATAVRTAAQARHWIRYWGAMRGVPPTSFTLSEYLPGRDFGCQSLWDRGRPVLTKAFERLSYIAAGGHPSGVSSVAALARTAADPRVREVTMRAVSALGRNISGLFSVDLKEDDEGSVCVTEINAGRFLAGTNLLDLSGKHNMAVTYVQLALGEPVGSLEEPDEAGDHYMVRDVDTLPGVFQSEEFLGGIEDARS